MPCTKPSCECKWKFSKKIKSNILWNTQRIRKKSSLIVDMEKKISSLHRESSQLQHSLKPKSNPERGSNSLQFYED